MKNKPKIAVIGLKGLPAFGGAASVGENIIEQLKDKYDFTVYSVSSHTNLKTGEYNGYKHIVFSHLKYKKLSVILYYIKSLIYVLINNYDLVHLHHRDASFIIPFLRLKSKVILTTHGMILTKKWLKFKKLFELQDKLFLGLANVITTVSLKDYEIVSKILRSNDKIVFIPNGVKINKISAKKDNTLVFAAGRILPDKGCHTLLEALIRINYLGKVIIIGDIEQLQAYKLKIFSLAKKIKNIQFKGLIRNKNLLNKYLNSAKIFVYPSEIESMSMMMLEVAALKVPIICSDIKENKDVFTDKEVLYFEKKNSLDLADKINWAFENFSIMKEKAENTYNKVKTKYQWGDIALKYDDIIKSLLFCNK